MNSAQMQEFQAMKSYPMAERRLGRSIVLTLSAALISGYQALQRQREPHRAPARPVSRKH